MDSQSFSLLDPDPDPGGKNMRTKTEKCKEIGSNCNFISKKFGNFGSAPWFITFEQFCLSFVCKRG